MSERGDRFASSSRPRGRDGGVLVGSSALDLLPGSQASEYQAINVDVTTFENELRTLARDHGVPIGAHRETTWGKIKGGTGPQPVAPTGAADPRWLELWNAFDAWRSGWDSWYDDHGSGSWWHNYEPDAERYASQLAGFRAQAAALKGGHLASPDPAAYSPSLLDPNRGLLGQAANQAAKAPQAASDLLADAEKIFKVALWGGLALGGTFAAVKIYEVARGGRGRR